MLKSIGNLNSFFGGKKISYFQSANLPILCFLKCLGIDFFRNCPETLAGWEKRLLKIKVGRKTKLVGNQCWLETKVGWKPMLVENQCWLETNVCWKPMLVGNQCWLETSVGWKPVVVGHQCWLDTKVGWTPKLREHKMGRGNKVI